MNALAEIIAEKLREDARRIIPVSASAGLALAPLADERQAELIAELFDDARPAAPVLRPVDFPVPEMVRIEPGEFMMGSDPGEPGADEDEMPKHLVRFSAPFEIGRFAVTFDEYDAFCERTQRDKPGDAGWGRGRRPAINVSYNDAEAYCAWLSDQTSAVFRLASEAEWEYCCRAGTSGPFSFPEAISQEIVNYNSRYSFEGSAKGGFRNQTVEVGTLPANPWKLHEMHGNVSEWCGAEDDSKSELINISFKRGGSYYNQPMHARSASRGWDRRMLRNGLSGFRVVRTLGR